ncbi:MAG: putative thiol-disulfide oxidoreductase [Dehalococcoidia bacterium]|nr:putative thiol-disulfide oxidoreductase [Dehalococcoidia bacterium]
MSSVGGLGVVETPNPNGLKVGSQVGQLAPNFRLEDETGKVLTLSDLRGTPLLINFWATWCGPCRKEMPELQEISHTLEGRLTVLAVDVAESNSLVQEFKQELGLTLTTPIDRANKVAAAYNAFGLPASYVIDEDGVVRAVKIGPFVDGADVRKSLKSVGLSAQPTQ